jgi:hypothetical protein
MDMHSCWTYGILVGFFPHGCLICPWMFIFLSFIGVMIDVIFWWMSGSSFDFLSAIYPGVVSLLGLSSRTVIRPGSVLCKLALQECDYANFVSNG